MRNTAGREMRQVNFRLAPDDYDRLTEIAMNSGVSRPMVLELLVHELLPTIKEIRVRPQVIRHRPDQG